MLTTFAAICTKLCLFLYILQYMLTTTGHYYHFPPTLHTLAGDMSYTLELLSQLWYRCLCQLLSQSHARHTTGRADY